MSEKIQPTHLARRAVVYLRQSTLKQVHEHRESTFRQYELRRRATALGWADERVELVDDDLGVSGASTEGRTGFQRLAEGVAHGSIGAVFALEVSRLARSSADWHRLLEICGLADVLIIDEQAVYSPSDHNDRLLLGLKGTMSEAELYWMRLRLQGGLLSKARRGDLFLAPPAGYVWDGATSRLRLDPDEEVQRAIRAVFERFRIDGSARSVARYLARLGLKLPARDHSGEYRWSQPRSAAVLAVLHSPIYSGAYVYGRRERKKRLVDGQVHSRCRQLDPDAWKVCLRDHHPAYIGWEEYVANQKRLDDNRAGPAFRRSAPREGSALLQGLALCGRCGHRMSTYYHVTGYPQYRCCSGKDRAGDARACWIVSSSAIDRVVEKLFLEAVRPPEVELGLRAVREVEKQAEQIDRQWKLRLDRARYEARLAERRYKAVDPDNRVVAGTLEREWNEKLRELEDLELEHAGVLRREKLELTDADRKRIVSLSKDLPRVWRADSTTHADRKNLLRMLVQDVTLTPIDVPNRTTKIQILWQTGAVAEVVIQRPSPETARITPREAVSEIRKLWRHSSDKEIAAHLEKAGIQTGGGARWTADAVSRARRAHRIGKRRAPSSGSHREKSPERRKDGLYSARGVAARFGVERWTVSYWVVKGWLRPVEGGGSGGHDRWFRLDTKTVDLLQKRVGREKRNGALSAT